MRCCVAACATRRATPFTRRHPRRSAAVIEWCFGPGPPARGLELAVPIIAFRVSGSMVNGIAAVIVYSSSKLPLPVCTCWRLLKTSQAPRIFPAQVRAFP